MNKTFDHTDALANEPRHPRPTMSAERQDSIRYHQPRNRPCRNIYVAHAPHTSATAPKLHFSLFGEGSNMCLLRQLPVWATTVTKSAMDHTDVQRTSTFRLQRPLPSSPWRDGTHADGFQYKHRSMRAVCDQGPTYTKTVCFVERRLCCG